jgi:hypothetical protein
VAAGGFSSASMAQGSEGKRRGAHASTAAWQREKEERGGGHGGRQCGAANNDPRPLGAGGSAVTQQGIAAGRG